MRAQVLVTLALAVGQLAPAADGDLIGQVRTAAGARNFPLAEQAIQTYRASLGVTPEMLEALSWLARGALEAKQYDRADRYALETRKLAVEMLGRAAGRPLPLDIALGAAIEVHAQALAARGERPAALSFLKTELAAYRRTLIAARIQKNINLLSLEGKPAPELDLSHWLGPKPLPLAAMKGHPVLLFFWAHWCGDCKGQAAVLARLMTKYGPRGLLLVGPTQCYGYAAGGADAAPDDEMRYIDRVRKEYYGLLPSMPVPVSTESFLRYGCSTTPTLVLVDRSGTVRLYHPGAMSYESLAGRIGSLVDPRPPES
jgi:thiol-disulfide isomerase/thioredoxin